MPITRMPIACGQTISQPYVVAYMTEQLQVKPNHRVLEIGTGSGYQAAVLSRLAREVFTIERFRTLADCRAHPAQDARLQQCRGAVRRRLCRHLSHAPYDRIMVTAAARHVPQPLVQQLAEGGIMILPLGPHAGRAAPRAAHQDRRTASSRKR